MKKTVAKYLCIILSVAMLVTALPLTVYAEDSVINVSTAEQLSAACTAINNGNGGEYTINLTADIIGGHIDITKSDAVVTVNGNGYAITNYRNAVNVSGGATVKLSGGSSTLTLQGSDDAHEIPVGNDDSGLIYVLSGSTCTMNADVTLKNHKGNNYLGGGVTVEGGTFVMNGGTIENCGIDGGSVCYGGGVAVFNSGYFEMNGGTITECYAKSDYEVQDYNRQYTAMGGGVFVSGGSVFTMNNGTISNCEATNFGGGVAMVGAGNINNLNSRFNLISGTISGNKALGGAGVFASAFHYAKANPISVTATIDGISVPSSGGTSGGTESIAASDPGLFINGGLITENTATGTYDSSTDLFPKGLGGGILVSYNGNTAFQIYNAKINSNNAEYGAGISSFYSKTNADIDGCEIIGNTAAKNGGGVYLTRNDNSSKTTISNTTITGNTSGDRGAGVYYDKDSALHISGKDIIQDNKFNGTLNNLNILSVEKPVIVDGALTGSQIGLSDPRLWDDNMTDIEAPDDGSAELLTSGYKENNSVVHPDQYFTSDHETWVVDRSEKTITEITDETSTYRVYTVERHPVETKGNYAGHKNQFVITDIQNPALTSISSMADIISELIYRFNNSNYTSQYNINKNNIVYIKYNSVNSDSPLGSVLLNKQQNNNYIDITYNAKISRGSSIVFRASENIQSKYPNSGKLVLQITSDGDNTIINQYSFSSDSTEETVVDYVDLDPPGNVLYEYDEYGDIAAQLIIGDCETKTPTITVETGIDEEVRLVRKKPNYHINNDEIDDNYNNNDIFTSYVEAATKEIKVGDTIEEFYTIPEVKATKTNSCPYIFKGWYYDSENDNDTHPVTFGTDKYSKDIYAHWIKVEDVAKDGEDDNELPPGYNGIYGGFDLAGVQVREGIRDTNYGYEKMPGGLRFVTSLNMDVVNQIKAIKQNNNIEYGYVAATNKGWIDYHHAAGRKLQYASTNTNGIDTSSDNAENKNYFGFASNIDCTSRKTNGSGKVNEDHRNFKGYLLYTLVITYENVEDEESAKNTKVLARPYIKYLDANGLERVAYSEYRGNSNTLGGCYTSYNAIAGNN